MGKFLITGGCGFIGSHLTKELIKRKHEIRILDDLSTGKLENIPSDVEVIVGSILDKTLIAEALEGVDGCYHLAAIASIERSRKEWLLTHQVNTSGTINLFENIVQSGKVIPVIFASSAAVYGDQNGKVCTEESLPLPVSSYGIDKLSSEYHAKIAWHLHKIPTISLRFFNVYGHGQDASSPYSGVISVFLKKILHEEPLTIFGDGSQERDFIYIDDVVRFCIRAMERCKSDSSVYNICSGEKTSINQLIELLETVFQKKVFKHFAPSRLGDIKSSFGSSDKAVKELGMKATTTLIQGLTKLSENSAHINIFDL